MFQELLAGIAILTIALPLLWSLVLCLYRGYKAYDNVNKIADQFKPNGGTSLKDAITMIQDTLDGLVTSNQVSMNLIPYPLLRADKYGHLEWCNREFSRVTGLTESEAAGLGWLGVVISDDREHARSEWFSALEDARSIKIEFRLDDGREAVLEALPLISVKHGVTGIVGTLRIESGFHYE